MRLLFLISLLSLVTSPALACNVCFKGEANDPNMVGLRSAIFFMLAILGVVLVALTKFFIGIGKRSKYSEMS